MAILIKLFEISIVASNLFGLVNNFLIFFIKLSSEFSGILDLFKEKNATSLPEVKADIIKKAKIRMIFIINEV